MEGSLDRCSYDDTEFLNSVKNGKNAVLSAAGQKSSTSTASAGSYSKSMFSEFLKLTLFLFVLNSASALKDVMRMIATRKNIRLEDGEVEAVVGSSGSTVEEQRVAAAVASGSKSSRSRGLGTQDL